MNVCTDTASVRSQQILVHHHFTTSTSYLGTLKNSEGKSMPRVLQNRLACSIESSIRTYKAYSEDIFHQLQHTKLPALARPKRHPWALSSVSRAAIFSFYWSRGRAKPRMRVDACCPASPSPTRLPLRTQSPNPHTWGWWGWHTAPAPGVGLGCGEAVHGHPACPACLLLAPRKGPAASGTGLQPSQDKEKRQGKAGLGPPTPAPGARSREAVCSWGDCSHTPSWQLQEEIREERMGNGSTGLLARIQALLQPLLFPESKRQIVKRRARTRLAHCNVHKKKGGAWNWAAPDPSAGPFPQQS